ncbi:MAG: aminopeptidase P family protein [SAR324 cluster bacterium]|nr:aminopeptidase P family protein [SAR324 cluster bacterium]MBL7034670.1 aminopeptidase P family protein [SAR324 cluster bacterium]
MIDKLLKMMSSLELDMLIVVSTDEHLNEYLPLQNRRLKASTAAGNSAGFSGSAGTAIFCVDGPHQLFVDSRYHLQAEQTCSEYFTVQRLGVEGVLEPAKWLAAQSKRELKIAADPFVMTTKEWRRFKNELAKSGHTLIPTTPNLVDEVWDNRPPPPRNEIYPLALKYTGKAGGIKLHEVRKEMNSAAGSDNSKADVLLLTMLDEVAWLTNLRGSDIDHNPVFEAYAAIFAEKAICFCHHPEVDLSSHCPEWEFRHYAEYPEFIKKLAEQKTIKVWLDPSAVTMGTRLTFSDSQVIEKESPIVLLKALKNSVEISAIKKAHQQAGAGVVRSLRRLQQTIKANRPITEKKYADWLFEEYKKADGFTDLSFGTIAGSGANGAIVHYEKPDSIKPMHAGEMLLVDSGIQCSGGTTDATRTLMLGKHNQKQKRIFTLVLQAHIRLARQVFPAGTKGSALDSITRSGLWNEGLDYGHGTGHGVGAFLNVHEGPQRISPAAHDVDLQAGMVISNEPGYYENDWGGIRLENLYLVKKNTDFPVHAGEKIWLCFEALTMIPFERRLIDKDLLSAEELQWLNAYHIQVMENLSPLLDNPEDLKWLTWACEKI